MGEKQAAVNPAANKKYKDTVFRALFKDRERLLGLYNAVSGRNYADPEKLEIITLENAVYMGMKNDLAFLTKEEEPELELLVKVLNINSGYNEGLKEQCRTLREYMQYVEKVRSYAESMTIKEAVDKAVEECIRQNILKKFLLQNKAEVKKMSIYEYDEEEVRQLWKEDAYEDGKIAGKIEGKIEGALEKLISLVCRKLRKDKTLQVIAEELEEEISVIEPIYMAAQKYAPEYDLQLIAEEISQK